MQIYLVWKNASAVPHRVGKRRVEKRSVDLHQVFVNLTHSALFTVGAVDLAVAFVVDAIVVDCAVSFNTFPACINVVHMLHILTCPSSLLTFSDDTRNTTQQNKLGLITTKQNKKQQQIN